MKVSVASVPVIMGCLHETIADVILGKFQECLVLWFILQTSAGIVHFYRRVFSKAVPFF